MAMDALKNLANNVPGWLTRLDDLSGQIEQRQIELAALAAAEGECAETKFLPNKSSNESLKPKDDVPITAAADSVTLVNSEFSILAIEVKDDRTTAFSPSHSTVQRSHGVIRTTREQQPQQAKRKQGPASMTSARDSPQTHRTRSMISVYYDSSVQEFFSGLVQFVSSSRILMRKANIAVTVAQIKKLAEVDVSGDEEHGDKNRLLLRYMGTRGYNPNSSIPRSKFSPSREDQPLDVYYKLDNILEIVQSVCQHGAHQFLRDGDCNDEIENAQKQLTEVLEMATKEMDRVQRKEPELAKETGEPRKVRTHRLPRMRQNRFQSSRGAANEASSLRRPSPKTSTRG